MAARIKYPKINEGETVVITNPKQFYTKRYAGEEFTIKHNWGNGRYELVSVNKTPWGGRNYIQAYRSEFDRFHKGVEVFEDPEYEQMFV